MKAIHLTAYGNPAQNLKMVEVSTPNAPSANEALVRIGGEGAGIVEAIGPGVTRVKVGDRVTIPFGTFTWSEKVLAPAPVFSSFRLQSMPKRPRC